MNAAQWTEFRRLFPAAASWLDAAELEDEHARLSAERRFLESTRKKFAPRPMPDRDAKRLAWIENRLAETHPGERCQCDVCKAKHEATALEVTDADVDEWNAAHYPDQEKP